MEKELLFALISTAFILIGAIPLWRDILKWRTIPHPFTTSIWLITVGLNSFILNEHNEYYWLIPSTIIFVTLFWETLVWILRMKQISMNWFDKICLWLGILTIIYFIFSRNTLNAVIMTMIIDGLAVLPTLKKSWIQPWTETAWNYLIWWIAMIFTILALTGISLETSMYWWFILFADLLVVFILIFRRWYLKGYNSIFE